jgi:ribose transport system substrate-binding protein
MKKTLLLLLLPLLSLGAACGGSGTPTGTPTGTSTGSAKKMTIAVIPKGTTHEFWNSIHAGSVKAARELTGQGAEVEVIWKGPLREDDREQQIQVVEGFISQGVDGIVLAPLDKRALVRPVEEAQRAGVPTVVIDSGLESQNIVSFVATDNLEGGRLAARRIGELLGGKGKALLLRYQEGSASTQEREEGFLQEMRAKYPNVEVISSDQYAGPTRDTAKRASENLLNRFGADLQAVFTPNESSTAGMLLALQDIERAGKIVFVGFDSSQPFVEAMRAKQLHGIVVQNPFKMGYLGVKTMVDHLSGKPVEKLVDTGVTIVTPENLESPETRELLNPPIAEYLR